VHPIPLSEVQSIRKHTPSFGWQHIVVVLVNGLTLPPLYFSNGGVKALFSALKQVETPAVACLCSPLFPIPLRCWP
jgi:Rab-binding domain (RBD)